MLVATAGHVDHGKTALIRRLTGIETDRLPEEKRRGLTIDLGFAYRPLANDTVLGFVDVPGHERFVRNMLAGVPTVHLALLVVAADDGPMPQTREHLAILSLLGVPRILVAISKIDRVSPDQVIRVQAETEQLVAESDIRVERFFPLSNVSGEGVQALELFLLGAAKTMPEPVASGRFRMAIDRSFTLKGAGLVVTGAVFDGVARVGDHLCLIPGEETVRVRAIHAQNRESALGRAGERLALNIAGPLSHDDLHRGQWLVATEARRVSDRFDAELRVLSTEARPLSHWSPVHVHHGAADLSGRVATLGGRTIAPGCTGLAQIVLNGATHLVHGDRFVLRDQSAQRTIAGGTVIDPYAPREGRNREQRVELLDKLRNADPKAAFGALIEHARDGVAPGDFAGMYNLTADEQQALAASTRFRQVDVDDQSVLISPIRFENIRSQLLTALDSWHRLHPDQMGPDLRALLGQLDASESRKLRSAVLDELLRGAEVRRSGRSLRLASHQPTLPARDAALWERIASLINSSSLQPPVISDLAEQLGIEPKEMETFLKRAVARGQLVRVSGNRFLHPGALARLGRLAESLAAESPGGRFDAKTLKTTAGIGRNFCIQILEYFDIVKLTRRVGDERIVIGDSRKLFGNDWD